MRPASYDIPDGVDLRETTRRLAPPASVVEATLLLRKGAGATLRRGAASIEHDVTGPDTDSPWDRVVLRGATGWPRSCWRSAPTLWSSHPRSCATTSSRGCGPRSGATDAGAREAGCRTGAKDQVARLLTLVPYLHSHPEVRLDETARAVGSTPEQVSRTSACCSCAGCPAATPTT